IEYVETVLFLVLLVLMVLCAVALSAFCVLIHEAGHALAGKLTNHRIHLIRVWMVSWLPRARRLSWSSPDRLTVGGMVGVPVSCVYSAPRDFLFTAGGPVANLLMAVLFVPAIPFHGPASLALGGTALASCCRGLMSLIPDWRGDSPSDGA